MGNPLSAKTVLKPGMILQDNTERGHGRQVKLLKNVNPMGLKIGPWWMVENTITKRKSVIREDRFKNTVRWSLATVVNEEQKRA